MNRPDAEFTFEIPSEWWLNSNDRYHFRVKSQRNAWIRDTAKATVRGRPAVKTPVMAVATISTPTRRAFDPPNAWPTLKPCIDALVLAGIIPDDSHEHIPVTVFQRGPKTGTPDYRIHLRLIGQWVPF